jgi:pimeloyl-ACP methyl ester carboxylesterase
MVCKLQGIAARASRFDGAARPGRLARTSHPDVRRRISNESAVAGAGTTASAPVAPAWPTANLDVHPVARDRSRYPALRMRYLYLHGFASGPGSKKGVAFAAHFAARGLALERLDLRVPSFEHLRLSAMIETARAAIGAPGAPGASAIVIGSSLGGLTAARLAERDPRVRALVLLAERWRETLGPELDDWRRTGWREVPDHTTGRPARVDYGFYEDAAALDTGFPDVTVPTLVLHGTADDVVPIARSRAFAAARSNVRLVELADNHELVTSLPTLLAETDRFLAALPPSP